MSAFFILVLWNKKSFINKTDKKAAGRVSSPSVGFNSTSAALTPRDKERHQTSTETNFTHLLTQVPSGRWGWGRQRYVETWMNRGTLKTRMSLYVADSHLGAMEKHRKSQHIYTVWLLMKKWRDTTRGRHLGNISHHLLTFYRPIKKVIIKINSQRMLNLNL